MRDFLYTIGCESEYDHQLAQGDLYKSIGGVVWHHYDEVLEYLKSVNGMVEVETLDGLKDAKAAIYKIEGSWYSDTKEVPGKNYRELINLQKIIEKVSPNKSEIYSKLKEFLNKIFTMKIQGTDKTCSFKIEYAKLTTMYYQGEAKETLRVGIHFLEGYVNVGSYQEEPLPMEVDDSLRKMFGLGSNLYQFRCNLKDYLEFIIKNYFNIEYVSIDYINFDK